MGSRVSRFPKRESAHPLHGMWSPRGSPRGTRPENLALRVLLVDDGGPHVALLQQELERLGCTVTGVVDAPVELAETVRRDAPDIVIISADSPQRDTLEHLAAVSRDAPRPMVMFSEDADRERMQRAIRAGVSSYVVAGLRPDRLMPVINVAIARFEAEAQLRAELETARTQLDERKRIERAKGILMRAHGLDEAAAYAKMRRLAMDRKMKLADVADRIIDAERLLG